MKYKYNVSSYRTRQTYKTRQGDPRQDKTIQYNIRKHDKTIQGSPTQNKTI